MLDIILDQRNGEINPQGRAVLANLTSFCSVAFDFAAKKFLGVLRVLRDVVGMGVERNWFAIQFAAAISQHNFPDRIAAEHLAAEVRVEDVMFGGWP